MIKFNKKVLIIGFGSVGQGLLPLFLSAFSVHPSQIRIIAADDNGLIAANYLGVSHTLLPLTPSNYSDVLARHLQDGDLLINLSVNVSSVALITWCKANDVLYLDTCVEPWANGYTIEDPLKLTPTNAWLRRQALSLFESDAATAIIAHGMNPGLISHFVKAALRSLASRKNVSVDQTPSWGELASSLGVRAVHIVERDTQDDNQSLRCGEFVNTWSAEGLYSEAWLQKSEVFWGSSEDFFPDEAQSTTHNNALRLTKSGANIQVKSWTPSLGEQNGILVTHHEVISIGELLYTADYSPTVGYVYNPSLKAKASLHNLQLGQPVTHFRVMNSPTLQGFDEVGVLLVHETGSLWHGTTLNCSEARRLVPFNNATSLQVVAGVIAALTWMFDNPRAGVVEAESLDSEKVLDIARPYLGTVSMVETDWRPDTGAGFSGVLATHVAQFESSQQIEKA